MNKLLLTHIEEYERYKQLGEKKVSPYFYKIIKSNQFLSYIGSKHTFNPNDTQLKVIKKYWNEFLDETKEKNCVVLVEGGDRPINSDDIEGSLIRKEGESSFIAYLAYKSKIKYYSPEPDRKEEIKEMLKVFNREDIIYYYIARVVLQWNKLNPKPDFVEYISRYFKRYKEITGWKDFDFSMENFIRLHNERHKHKFNERDEKCFYHDSNPFTSEVCRMCGNIRDEHILNEILKLWEKGKNIFIIFGSGHAIKQERALRSILK